MKKLVKTLRARLIIGYVGTIAFFTLFFYVVVHNLALPHSDHIYIFLFIFFSLVGIFLIYSITKSITYLSSRIKHISRRNLDERILDIKSEDEIGELATSFNNLLDHLDDAFKREQQFIADVAHELKTPLATQRSSLEVTLSKERTKEVYKKALEEALEENNQLSSTLKNILDLAWSETYTETKKNTVFNLSELIEELCDIAEKMAQAKHLTIQSSVQKDIAVNGFKDKFARAILNIIDNAIKYTHRGTITIQLKKTKTNAIITIIDTGQGISKEETTKIFSRFYRGSKTDKIFGSGLGLAITKSVISLHHGSITVESKLNKGTTFTIFLPIKH